MIQIVLLQNCMSIQLSPLKNINTAAVTVNYVVISSSVYKTREAAQHGSGPPKSERNPRRQQAGHRVAVYNRARICDKS